MQEAKKLKRTGLKACKAAVRSRSRASTKWKNSGDITTSDITI